MMASNSTAFDSTVAQELDAVLARWTADPYNGVPRVVVQAATSSGIIYKGAAGYEHLPPHPATPEQLAAAPRISERSIFELWSCTKLVGVIAALQCAERGLIDLHADASQYVPELAHVKVCTGYTGADADRVPVLEDNDVPITADMLITHTAGFTYYFTHEQEHDALRKHLGIEAMSPYLASATADTLLKFPALYKPGTSWHYGTSNDWLTLIVERVTGTKLNDYVQENIMKPLGITDISYSHADKLISIGHEPVPWTLRPGSKLHTEQHYGGAGLHGSPASYFKIVRAILGRGQLPLDGVGGDESDSGAGAGAGAGASGRILKPETVDSMFESHLSKDPVHRENQLRDLAAMHAGGDPWTKERGGALPGSDWGYGGMITGEGYPSGRASGALHWSGMANTWWVVDRKKDLAFVIFCNVLPYGATNAMACWKDIEPLLYKGAGRA